MSHYIPTDKDIQRFWSKVDKSGGEDACWIWQGVISNKGYGQICTSNRTKPSHRVSYIIHFGIIPEKMYVCHHCDNPKCVNPKHLFLGTSKDNAQDKIKKGRSSNSGIKGEHSPNAKITRKKAEEIRTLFASSNITRKQIADMYGLSYWLIRDIVSRKSWK